MYNGFQYRYFYFDKHCVSYVGVTCYIEGIDLWCLHIRSASLYGCMSLVFDSELRA